MNISETLLTLSIKCKGEWHNLYDLIKNKYKPNDEEIEQAKASCKSNYFSILDERYPDKLKTINKPPILVYYYGDISLLSEKYMLTAIGTRKPNLYQSNTTYEFIKESEEMMNDRLVIVSGMATGIDQCAMKAAMDRNAPIVSVIGSGIDDPYPEDNQGIYEYCKSGKGLVISEYPGMTKAKSDNFVFRNRLLAGLTDVLFVGAGKKRSGTSSTVSMAIESGSDVLALPCNVDKDELTNKLIQDGAYSVLSSSDLVQYVKDRCDVTK